MAMEKLPGTFPTQIEIAFQEAYFKGEKQLSAQFEHEGKRYKLVMTGGAYQQAGVVRTVYVHHSPNGHIVFCALYPPSDEEDEHWSDYNDEPDYEALEERREADYFFDRILSRYGSN